MKWCMRLSSCPSSPFATCLTGANDLPTLSRNLANAGSPLTDQEKELLSELEHKFFKWMTCAGQWENKEVMQYWAKMKENGWQQNTDI